MSKKIRLGYDILSKRAIETESGVNIDDALKKITSYKKVPGTGEDNHPDEPRPSTKVIYFVKVDGASQPDTYKEWIWNQPADGVGNWECIGGTSDDADSWKRWSENRGSTGEGESVYLGVNNIANRDETYVLGKGNTVSVTDETDYTNTDVVEIGSENTATDAANTYQLGRENTVTGNNLANKEQYPHSMAMNLGRNNSITGEGVNIGKDNVSSTFGVTVGQRNQATDASIAIGEDVDSYSGSISIGHGKPSANSDTLPMLSMTVDGEEIPAQKIKLDLTEYTYYVSASVFKTASNTYEWGEIGEFSTRVTLYENQVLHTYLVGGNSASYRRVTGYFDSNGNFISSTDPSYNIKEYDHITEVNDVPVDFYCSRENGTNVAVSGYFKKSETQPELGTVLNASEYAEWLSKLSISDARYTNINVYTADLSAPAMKCYDDGTNRPFYTQYSVYGYRDDNNNFIPYNDVTKYKSNAFAWETIPADELHASELDPAVVGYEIHKTISRNDSIAIGKSMEADTSSFGIGIGTPYPPVMYEKASDANGWIGYTNTRYKTLTISQVDGSVAQSGWITYNRVWFNSPVDDISWRFGATDRTVMGNSIALVNTGGSPSYNNYLAGASVGIGNGLKLTDNSFGFGTNLEGDNNSVLVGANLTAQVGGSTLVGRDISVKIGDSDNDGGSINGEYDGGLVAFGMSIAPSPGSVTVGRSGVTTGRGSIAVGASGIYATRGSVVYGRNGVSAEGRATAIGTDGISAKNASITVGLDGISAEDGSAVFGSNGISAYSGSISIGRDGNSARSGSMALGFSNDADHYSLAVGRRNNSDKRSVAMGNNNLSSDYAVTMGMANTARGENVAIGIGNSADNNSYSGSHGIAIGEGNTSQVGGYNISFGLKNASSQEAVSIGTSNTVHGWSIALGVSNTSYDGPGGHATMIGQYNTSTSNQEVIHKEFQIYVDNDSEPTQEQIDELTGRESAYRRLLDPYLDSEMIASLNTADAGNNEFYFGRSDEMAWGYYSYISWLQQLGNQPPFTFSASDRAALESIQQQQPQTLEEYKTLMLQICDVVQNYANVDELRRSINAATTMDDINTIWATQLWQDIGRSLQWSGDPIPGVVSDYDALQQILDAYRSWNIYGLSIRSSLAPHYETIDEDVVCNSFLVGNNNKSNHYNSILLGSLNESQAPLVHPDATDNTTDDDGFMIAVGYRNVVGRNYDVAIGYLSKAIGGENVALQHSEAEGYRNFAAFDSKVRGTANVLLGESTLLIPWDGNTSENINKLNAATHNLMFNSLSENITQPIGRYMQNVLLDVDLATDAQSVTENFIYGGAGHENNTKVELTAGTAVTGNVILGSQHGSNQLKITCTNAIIDNIINHPSSIIANASYAFHRNILIGQGQIDGDVAPVLDINSSETVIKNIVIHGSIIGKSRTFINNIVLNDSQIESTYGQGDGGCVINNILLNNAKLVNTDVETWWAGSGLQPCTDNIVIGANVSDSINSVIISDSGNGAQISDALRIFNFGDNFATHVAEGRVFGGYNTIQCAKKFFISGDQNTVASNAEAMGTTNGSNSFTTIFGSDNRVTSTPDAVCIVGNSRNTIFGCANAIRGSSVGDNSIFGSKNQIGSFDTDYNITECFVSGSDNLISSRVNAFTILGKSNSVHCDGGPSGNKLWAIGNGFVQGNDNCVYFGSNAIAMGNGNIVEGHNAVAIGCQLKSNRWQTVIGKYNQPVDGPDRLTSADDPSQSNKALFIVGNGYSTKDDRDWKDEQFITRSNAMVVYANGDTVFSGNVNAANLPPAPSNDGQYALNCIVTNGVPSYSWVPVGTVTV